MPVLRKFTYGKKLSIYQPALVWVCCCLCFISPTETHAGGATRRLKVGVFRVDATPPIGSPVLNTYAGKIEDSLSARGIVILSGGKPVVLCSVDWVGIANEGMDMWRSALARAAGTDIERVSVHVVHQHDAPRCDFTTEKILREYGFGGARFDTAFLYRVIRNTSLAVEKAVRNATVVTHIGFGEAIVEKVASNRRILGKDGKVSVIRNSRTSDKAAIEAPEGTIDPLLKAVSFWNKKMPLAVLTFYATHPMSYYGRGEVSADFIGLARTARERDSGGLAHIHFNGAGGNIAAGKYNDGSGPMRAVLAERIEKAMAKAWHETTLFPVKPDDIKWTSVPVKLPLRDGLDEHEICRKLADDKVHDLEKYYLARHFAWILRVKNGMHPMVSALQLKEVGMLFLPGELFVEYQLAAQELLPGKHLCTAAYGDLGPFYIGTEKSYEEGGYETQPDKSLVGPSAEAILMKAIRFVLIGN